MAEILSKDDRPSLGARLTPWLVGLLVLLLVLGATIELTLRRTGLIGPGTAAPSAAVQAEVAQFAGNPNASRSAVLAYAANLFYNDAVHASADTARLLVRTDSGLAVGPPGIIVPERDAHHNSLSALVTGRVVARIELDDDYVKGDTVFIPRGTSYLWVDGLNRDSIERGVGHRVFSDQIRIGLGSEAARLQLDADRTNLPQTGRLVTSRFERVGRVFIIPADTSRPVVQRPLRFLRHDGARRILLRRWSWYTNLALARWIYKPQDDDPWVTCARHGCCEVMGPGLVF